MKNVMCFLLIFIGLAACTYRKDDISNESRARQIIGTRYKIVSDVTAYGVRPYDRADPDVVILTAPPGFAGPEVAFEQVVHSGAKITVLKVLKSNRILENPYILVVRLEGANLDTSLPIFIELFGNNGGDKRISLNPEFYERIDNITLPNSKSGVLKAVRSDTSRTPSRS